MKEETRGLIPNTHLLLPVVVARMEDNLIHWEPLVFPLLGHICMHVLYCNAIRLVIDYPPKPVARGLTVRG